MVVAFLVACTDDGGCLLVGTWLANDMVKNLILNSNQDRFGMALDTFIGGDASTLLGTWASTQSIESPSFSVTRT